MKYLLGYPQALQDQARAWLEAGTLGPMLQSRYPQQHAIRTDGALYDYATGLKNRFLRGAPPLSKVRYDNKLQVVAHALGTHTTVARVQGTRLKAKREIRIAALFRHTPSAFLRMIMVHELAHLKESAHGRAFYQLCCHMEPDYHQLEFDLRLYLSQLELPAAPVSGTVADAAAAGTAGQLHGRRCRPTPAGADTTGATGHWRD